MAKRLTVDQKDMYALFMSQNKTCWACGWTGKPYRSWMINRLVNAHIIGGSGRRHDRRDINRLCDGCHLLSHGNTIRINGEVLPKLTLGNMLWLKKKFDPKFYDLDYLATLSAKINVTDEDQPKEFRLEFSRIVRG